MTAEYAGDDRRSLARRMDDLEARFKNEMMGPNSEFRFRVQGALFNEKGESRIWLMEEQNDHIERALFNEEGKNRVALMEIDMKTLLRYLDRGKFTWMMIAGGWVGLGSIVGWFFKH